jgi:hypothetical protein
MLAHRLKQRRAVADDMIDRDQTRAADGADDVAQQRLPVLNPAGAQVVAVEMEQVEGEIGDRLKFGFRNTLRWTPL